VILVRIRAIGFVVLVCVLASPTGALGVLPPPAPSRTTLNERYNELLDPAKYRTVSLSNVKDIRLSIKASSLSYIAASISADPSAPRTTGPAAKIVTRGKPCSTGPSAAALERCRTAFDALTRTVPLTAWVDPFAMQTQLGTRYLVVTMGGRAWVLDPGSADGRKAFGRIDTPTEVAWVTRSLSVRRGKGGFVYLETSIIQECPMQTQSRAMFINTATGRVSTKAEGPVESTGVCA
jgi:hypothetical protein